MLNDEIQNDLIAMIRQADRRGALAILEEWAGTYGYDRVLADVIEPTLTRIGKEWWQSKNFTLAQAYVAAKVTEDVVLKVATGRIPAASQQPPKGVVVIGNIEEDFHALGRRMVSTFLRADGFTVYDLGNDVPAVEFVDKAIELGARVIGVSAMMHTTAQNIRKVRDEIDSRGHTGHLQLAAGGAVFGITPGLLETVGADGGGTNALGAASLFSSLWNRSIALETQG